MNTQFLSYKFKWHAELIRDLLVQASIQNSKYEIWSEKLRQINRQKTGDNLEDVKQGFIKNVWLLVKHSFL